MEENSKRRITRRQFLRSTTVAGLGIGLSPLLAGCAKTEEPSPAPGETGPVTLDTVDIMSWYDGVDVGGTPAPDVQAKLWKELYPEGEVAREVWPWAQAHDKFVTLFRAGRGPDIGIGFGDWLGEFAARGVLANLDELIDDEFRNKFHETWLNYMTYKGTLVSLPFLCSVRASLYRPDWFEELGLKPPTTLDNIMTAAKAIHDPPDRYGYATCAGRNKNTVEYFLELAWPYGLEIFDDLDEPTDVLFNNDTGVEALEWYVELCQYAQPGLEAHTLLDARQLYQDGKAGVYVGMPFAVTAGLDKNPDMVWAVGGAIEGPAGKVVLGVVDMYFMYEGCEHKKEAFDFMKMRYDPSIEHEVLAKIGTPPLIKGDENIDFYQEKWDLEQGFIESIPYAKFRPHTPAWPKVQDSLAIAIQKAILGEATPKEALDEAAIEAWAALAELSY